MPARALALLLAALTCAAGPARADDAEEADPPEPAVAFEIAGEPVEPGTTRQLSLAASESFAGTPVAIPVTVIHGAVAGPVACLTAGVHGDEINGVEAVRQAVERIDVANLRGTVVAISIVNVHGFRRGSRYLPDRRDLNRHFPGRERGSAASRIARVVFDGLVRRCDFLLDFHTGSFQRANLPHVRGDLSNPGVRELVEGLGGWLVLDHPGTVGTLRRAASDAGVPTITFEVGGPYRLEPVAVDRGTAGASAVLAHMGMLGRPVRGAPEVVTRSRWVRVDDGGLLFTHVQLGQAVSPGELLGVVVEPTAHERSEVRSPWGGRVIGMAWQQVVIPGFAAFHVALQAGSSLPDVDDPDADDDAGRSPLESLEGVDSEEVPE